MNRISQQSVVSFWSNGPKWRRSLSLEWSYTGWIWSRQQWIPFPKRFWRLIEEGHIGCADSYLAQDFRVVGSITFLYELSNFFVRVSPWDVASAIEVHDWGFIFNQPHLEPFLPLYSETWIGDSCLCFLEAKSIGSFGSGCENGWSAKICESRWSGL